MYMNVTAKPRAMAFKEQTRKYFSSLPCKENPVLRFPPCQLISGDLPRRFRECFGTFSRVKIGKVFVDRGEILISVVVMNLAEYISTEMKHLSLRIRCRWASSHVGYFHFRIRVHLGKRLR